MNRIVFELQTITPMFMAGADGATFELRPPSIKGAMRFWWRAYYWGMNSGKKLDIKSMEEKEGKIFGTTSNNGRKSRFSIHLRKQGLRPTTKRFPSHLITVTTSRKTFKMNILDYLAYGTYEPKIKDVFSREYLPAEQSFTISLNISEETVKIGETPINIKEEVIRSFYFLAVFGGLGAKSRNGFGSFTVMNPEVFSEYGCPYTYPFPGAKDLVEFKKFNHEKPPFSAFSRGMKIFKLQKSFSSWDHCLAELGKNYRDARNSLERKHEYEKRQYIAAPIIAGKTQKSFLDRRAKPYFMRVVKQNPFEGYIVYLPSKYCAELQEDRSHKPIDQTEVDYNFQIYCDQFNRLLEREMRVVL